VNGWRTRTSELVDPDRAGPIVKKPWSVLSCPGGAGGQPLGAVIADVDDGDEDGDGDGELAA